ncbi:PGC-1 and ERR-induced regulator in muscle protein 1 isoform X1 [Pelodiscus sinensis]|uniref:PGC-1 and ERR-induced regulator in muscle protein 1 isoform X1 n=1 Tax=Pelodiscus sinensis TaxID=13735 RepID=UPI003F6BC26F
MENFEYSIQLNDRDWAEFYLASEECSLIPAALASADEQCFSDIEQGDSEDDSLRPTRLITVRAGCTPAVGTGHYPQRGVLRETSPSWPLRLAREEVLSGSEDEMDVGSVSRFLCENDKPGNAHQAALRPSTQDGQLPFFSEAGSMGPASPALEKLLLPQDSLRQELGQTAERAAAARAGGGVPDGALQPGGLLRVHLQSRPEKAESERPVHAADGSSPATAASEGVERPAGEKANWPVCLAARLPDSNSAISQNPSAGPLQPACSRIAGKSCPAEENPEERRRLGHTWTASGSPGDSPAVMEPMHWGESCEHQGTPTDEVTPSHGALAPALEFLTPSALLRESKGEGTAAKPALEGLAGEDEASQYGTWTCGVLRDEGRGLVLGGQAASTPRSKGVKGPATQSFPEVKQARGARPKQATDSGVRENAPSAPSRTPKESQSEACESTTGKPLHLGNKEAFGGDVEDGAHGRQRPGLLRRMFSLHSAAEDSLEGATPALTWPEMCDYFFCDTQEPKNNQGRVEETPLSFSKKEQEVPEMYGPEMYEYFFNDPEESWEGGSKETFVEPDRASGSLVQTLSLCESREEPGLATAGEPAGVLSIPEIYEHFFDDGTRGRRSWGEIFLSMPAWEARKAMMAVKSLLRKPTCLVRCSPRNRAAPVPRGSRKRLPLLQLRLPTRIELQPEDLGMAPVLAGGHVPGLCCLCILGCEDVRSAGSGRMEDCVTGKLRHSLCHPLLQTAGHRRTAQHLNTPPWPRQRHVPWAR